MSTNLLLSPRIRRKYKVGVRRRNTSSLTVLNINKAEEKLGPSQLFSLLKAELSIRNDTLDTVVLINKVASMLYDNPLFTKYFSQYGITFDIIQEILQDAKIVSLKKNDKLFEALEDINQSYILIDGKISIKLPLAHLNIDDIIKRSKIISQFYHIDNIDYDFLNQFDPLLKQRTKKTLKRNSTSDPKVVQFNQDNNNNNKRLSLYKNGNMKFKSKAPKNCCKLLDEIEVELFEVSNCFIGELDLSYQSKRVYSAYANTECCLLSIDRVYTDYLMKLISKAESDKKVFLMDHAKSLMSLSKNHLADFFKEIGKEIYYSKETIYLKNEKADSIYLIYQGNCSTLVNNHVIYDKGDFFGLEALKQYVDIQIKIEEQSTALSNSNSNNTNSNNIHNQPNEKKDIQKYGVYSNTIITNALNTIVLKIKISSIPSRIFKSFSEELLICHSQQSKIRNNYHQLKQNKSIIFQIKYQHLKSAQHNSNPNINKLRETYSINQQINNYKLTQKKQEPKNGKQSKISHTNKSKLLLSPNVKRKKSLNENNKVFDQKKREVLQLKGRNQNNEMELIYNKIKRNKLAQSADKIIMNSSQKQIKSKSFFGERDRNKSLPQFNSSCSLISVGNYSNIKANNSNKSDGCSQIQLHLLTGTIPRPSKYLTLTERIQCSVSNWRRTVNNDQRVFDTNTYRAPLFSFMNSV